MKWRNYEVAVRRSNRRKTMHIVVERDGTLAVQVPSDMPESRVEEILESRAYDVFIMLEKWRESHKEQVHRQFRDGQSFLYLGRSYRLKFIQDQCEPVILRNGNILLRKDDSDPRTALIGFYKRMAKVRIGKRVRELLPGFPVPKKVAVRDMSTRWGSCTPGGVVTYNWRCVLVPPRVMDYLIVHELAHLEHHRHSRAFWDKIASVLPGFESSVEWLRINGVRTEI